MEHPSMAQRAGRRVRLRRRNAVGLAFLMFLVAESLRTSTQHHGESARAFHGVWIPPMSHASVLTTGSGEGSRDGSREAEVPSLHFVHGSLGIFGACSLGATALVVSRMASPRDVASPSRVQESKDQSWLQQSAPVLLVMILVVQKCSADALTWYTRAQQHMHYSASNVTLVSEIMKFPILMFAVVFFGSAKELVPTIKAAFTESPFAMWWVGLLYAVQNLLYFVCLQYTSAAAYQVLSQTKMIFTAAFMWQMMGKTFSRNQIVALGMLVVGTVFTQLAEIQGPMAGGSRPWLGASLAVLSALLAALPNVFYERMLKAQKNQWVSNLQLTTWICAWVAIIKGLTYSMGGEPAVGHLSELFDGFTIAVWVIVALKTMNCIIIPSCLKYADNILYGYAKPVSIVLTVIVTALATMKMPSAVMLAGISLVATSIVTYGRG